MRVITAVVGVLCLLGAGGLVFWLSDRSPPPIVAAGAPLPAREEGKNAEGEYMANPFGKPGRGPHPKLVAPEVKFEFGVMGFPLVDRDGDNQPDGDSHSFVIRNEGEGVLKLARGPSTCQCTMSDLKDVIEVPPGGETTITVTWKPDFPADDFHKGAGIWTNDPALFGPDSPTKDGKIQFDVHGMVVNAVQAEPEQFSLGILNEHLPSTFESIVYSRLTPDLPLAVKEVSSPFIKVELEPLDEAMLKEKEARSGFRVKGQIEPKLPIGRVSETVTLTTGAASRPEVQLKIEGQRQGPMSIAGRYWNNALTIVDFSRFSAAKGIETKLYLYGAKGETPLELKLAELRPEGLIVTAERDPNYADAERERFLIHVQVPAGRAPERLVGKEAGTVRFETNRLDVPEVKFRIVYESH